MKSEKITPMTVCTQEKLLFPEVKRRKVEVNFEGGNISSDGGSLEPVFIFNYASLFNMIFDMAIKTVPF